MKKLIIALLALAVLFSLAAPAMAASPAKDYASAKDGDLLYTVNFNGDEAFTPGNIVNGSIFNFTPTADGTGVEIKGASFKDDGTTKDQGTIWGGKIPSLAADATTVYTMTFQIWMDATDGGLNTYGGKDCFAGVGGMWESTANKWYSFTSNYFTATAENRAYSMRKNSGTQKDADGNAIAGVFAEDLKYAKDADGFVTMRLTFDGPSATYTAYIQAENGSWTKIISSPYTVATGDCVAFCIYSQRSVTHAIVKNVNIYKGEPKSAASTPDVDEPSKTADTFTGMIVALFVLSAGAVVTLTTSRKRFF